MVINDNLSIYGDDFQKQLIYDILTDSSFGMDILDSLVPNYFSDKSYINLIRVIKNYYEKNGAVPTVAAMKIEIESTEIIAKDSVTYQQVKDTLDIILNSNFNNLNVKTRAIEFCKTKQLYTYVSEVKADMEKLGDYKKFKEYENRFNSQFGRVEGVKHSDVFDDLDNTLSSDFRDPIPCGIEGIDNLIGGGLAKGDLGLIIAPLGVGKTTILTKIANSAYNQGKKVVQFVFEDKSKVVKRKHYTVWTGISLNSLDNTHYVGTIKSNLRAIKEKLAEGTGYLEIIKLPADGVTVDRIKNILTKISITKGAPDLVTIDYLDCINPEKTIGRDEWSSDGKIMRRLETISEELDFACWVATQGNRESTTATQITAASGGGSIKKSQIAHLVIGIAKTMEQKEADKATISIIKNRFGDDGMVYENCVFKNKTMYISTTSGARSINDISSSRTASDRAMLQALADQEAVYEQIVG